MGSGREIGRDGIINVLCKERKSRNDVFASDGQRGRQMESGEGLGKFLPLKTGISI